MRSFGITALATLAFGIFSSAAPAPVVDLIFADLEALGLISGDIEVDIKRGLTEYSTTEYSTDYSTKYSTSTKYPTSTKYSTSTSTSYYPTSTSYSSSSSEDKCFESIITEAVDSITKIVEEISEIL